MLPRLLSDTLHKTPVYSKHKITVADKTFLQPTRENGIVDNRSSCIETPVKEYLQVIAHILAEGYLRLTTAREIAGEESGNPGQNSALKPPPERLDSSGPRSDELKTS